MIINGTDLTMIQGDTEELLVKLQEDSIDKPLVTGDTVYFTVKRYAYETTATLQKVITAFTDGCAIIVIAPEDTNDVKENEYVYDIQITFAAGRVKTIIKPSMFKIISGVTAE